MVTVILALLLTTTVMVMPAPAGIEVYSLSQAIRRIAIDPVITAAETVRNEKNRAELAQTLSPRLSRFVEAGRTTDNFAPNNQIFDDEITLTTRSNQFDNVFGGVELFMPVAGGSFRLQAGERFTSFHTSGGITNPNTRRLRTIGSLTVPVYPRTIQLDRLSEKELENEVEYRHRWSDYRSLVIDLSRLASTAAWNFVALEDMDSYVNAAVQAVQTATKLKEFGEISEIDLTETKSDLLFIRAVQNDHVAKLKESKVVLQRFFGDSFIIRPSQSLPDPDSVVFPPIEVATEVVVNAAELALAEKREEIVSRETGLSINITAINTNDHFQDIDRIRNRTFIGISASSPLFDPSAFSKRNVAASELKLAQQKFAEANSQAEAKVNIFQISYAAALSRADLAEQHLAIELKNLKVANTQYENYTDPKSIVTVVQQLKGVVHLISKIYNSRLQATDVLSTSLIEQGVGIETLSWYLQ